MGRSSRATGNIERCCCRPKSVLREVFDDIFAMFRGETVVGFRFGAVRGEISRWCGQYFARRGPARNPWDRPSLARLVAGKRKCRHIVSRVKDCNVSRGDGGGISPRNGPKRNLGLVRAVFLALEAGAQPKIQFSCSPAPRGLAASCSPTKSSFPVPRLRAGSPLPVLHFQSCSPVSQSRSPGPCRLGRTGRPFRAACKISAAARVQEGEGM